MASTSTVVATDQTHQSAGLFGVFDGHGGAFAGRYTAANFQPVFSATDGWKSTALLRLGAVVGMEMPSPRAGSHRRNVSR